MTPIRDSCVTDDEKWDDYHERYDEWEERKDDLISTYNVSDYATEKDLEEFKRLYEGKKEMEDPDYYLREFVYNRHVGDIYEDFYANDPEPLTPVEEYEARESDKADEARDD